ncbi:MAG TPA: threonine--tRNA ligase [Planctomycetota bacterium]|nr:threonine--tRNA ligase [Planctomycetota bacterium]
MAVRVTFPDGSVKEFPDGVTALQVAESISKNLAKVVVAAKVNGEIWDFHRSLPSECTLLLIKEDSADGLDVIRHSAAHVMAGAVKRIYGPAVKFGYGPPVENGFYYDMEFPEGVKVSEEDLPKIEAECRRIIEENHPFVRKDIPKEQAVVLMRELGQGYKVQTIQENIKEPTASIYTDGDFTDLCEGPHVPSTGRVKAIKLTKVTGAYWKGDQKNRMLTRLYGTAWHSQKALDDHLKQLEEAKKRDHRKLGQELELFMFHDWSPGAVFFLPKGAVVYNELLAFIREEYRRRGFSEVVTPQLYNKGLWELSGHWEHYQENMFILDIDEDKFSLKPMNCPSHVLMFKHRRRSYRELPMRIADFCPLHRNEVKGVLSGMTRVRKFEQDDAHIFCTEGQIEAEIAGQIDFVNRVYNEVFKMPFQAKLSTRPPKFLGKVETWDRAEAALEKALKEKGVSYAINAGDGAFYGPKIDFDIRDALGRAWQLATIQLDFQLPLRMGAEYEGQDGQRHVPVMIHRAMLGSFERFIAILTEHYAGEFPLWLAPVQAAVIAVSPVSPEIEAYARKVHQALLDAGLRSEIDLSGDNISDKIKPRELQKVPYMAVVGAKEAAAGTVAVRRHKKGNLGVKPLAEFVESLRRDVAAKTAL